MLGRMLPKLYTVNNPRSPYRVVFIDPAGKRKQRHFADPKAAHAYHRELLAKAKVAGTVGLVLDAEMRADYFAARRALDGVPIMDAVRFYLAHRPVGLGASPIQEALNAFLQEKRRIGRSPRTIHSLELTLRAFIEATGVSLVSDYTRAALTGYLDKLPFPPLTIRNHRARLNGFGEWLTRRQYIPENPARYIDVAHYDLTPPRILTPDEARRVMDKAAEYRGGHFAGLYALALYAGLRHGEILKLTWEDIHLTEENPIIRVGRGKIRGRRSVRIVPILPILRHWLEWVRERGLPLVGKGDSRKIRAVVDWQPDICRHSWISYRLAMVGDEVQVAREAGNSPDIIYRHYYQLTPYQPSELYFKPALVL